jgi:hypothetical protein
VAILTNKKNNSVRNQSKNLALNPLATDNGFNVMTDCGKVLMDRRENYPFGVCTNKKLQATTVFTTQEDQMINQTFLHLKRRRYSYSWEFLCNS